MTVINKKNISTSGFDDDALSTTTSGESIINFGDLWTSGDLANGIYAGAHNVVIRNFGQIETSGLGAAGIFANGDNAHIENYGSVVTHGSIYDPDPDLFGDEFFSEGIFANGVGFYIANHGNIRVEGEFSSGLVGVGANGVIVNYGSIDGRSVGSIIIGVLGDKSQAINVGQVTVAGRGTDGMSGNGGTHLTNKGIIVVTATDGFGMAAYRDGDQLSNFGQIQTHGRFAIGIATHGLNHEVINTGQIVTEGDWSPGIALGFSRSGFSPLDAYGTIINSGVIETKGDGAAGVLMSYSFAHLINSGRLTTHGGTFEPGSDHPFHAAGVVVLSDDALVENSYSGVIESTNAVSAAVELGDPFTDYEFSSRLENYGLIKGAAVAVLGGGETDTVINHGQIMGDVVLGEGPDTFIFAQGGSLTGMLFLGYGYADLVSIEKGSGSMTIADFEAGPAGPDIIDISAFYNSFADLKAHSYQFGNDVAIGLGHHDQLVLANVKLGALDSGDFMFNPTT